MALLRLSFFFVITVAIILRFIVFIAVVTVTL
jgi:hypothetical protein